MKLLILLSLFFYFSIDSFGQTKKIKGRVISEDFEVQPEVRIQEIDTIINNINDLIQKIDTTIIGKTDMNGYFEVEIPIKNTKLMFGSIGMEWTPIELIENCNVIELIIQFDSTYDFMTFRKIDRIRRKSFKKLPNLYQIAYKKGLFTFTNQCFKQMFVNYNVK